MINQTRLKIDASLGLNPQIIGRNFVSSHEDFIWEFFTVWDHTERFVKTKSQNGFPPQLQLRWNRTDPYVWLQLGSCPCVATRNKIFILKYIKHSSKLIIIM
jgi:hypothetical protein